VFQAKFFLVIASLFFYSWWNIVYIPLILGSVLVNYFIGSYIKNKTTTLYRKKILILGIVFNVILLAYFKYSDFFIENFNLIFGTSISLFNLALPLAISFFTFQQIAYLVDSYKYGDKKGQFLDYLISFTLKR
jgi:D-alanyl-lipoteichoic acid acyltransferase DltB (MBOAT superfamily)